MSNKNIFLNFILPLVFVILLITPAVTVEISLDEQAADSDVLINVGYVDIEKVFEAHPMAKRLKEEFYQKAENKKLELQDAEAKISSLKKVVVSSTTMIDRMKEEVKVMKNISQNIGKNIQDVIKTSSTIDDEQGTVQISTQTPQQPPQRKPVDEKTIKEKEKQIQQAEEELALIKKDLETQQLELIKVTKKNKEELISYEKELTNRVLADIYHILDRVSQENRITIILDKKQVVYGQSMKDLTDTVLDRLRGR
ncbi:MAG: OmpH family outer membrane protein [Endomicrobiales bacterium]|nr:OmpH family outer membrane protein [Endomicrobiales bacterium]